MSEFIKMNSLNGHSFFVSNFNKAENHNNKGWENNMVNQILVFNNHLGINEASQIFWGPCMNEKN